MNLLLSHEQLHLTAASSNDYTNYYIIILQNNLDYPECSGLGKKFG